MYIYYMHTSMTSEKRNTEYSQTVNWIQCKLRFALLRALVMSIRGARSSRHHVASEATQDLQLMEGQFHGVVLVITITITRAHALYTCMHALTLRIHVHVTESYTEKMHVRQNG